MNKKSTRQLSENKFDHRLSGNTSFYLNFDGEHAQISDIQ